MNEKTFSPHLGRCAVQAAVIAAGALVLLLAACSPPPPIKLRDTMAGVVAPQAQTIWDVSNRGVNDEGEPDAGKLTTADWAALVDATQSLRDAAAALTEARKIEVAAPGQKILNEGEPNASNAAQVQALIDKDAAGFSKMAGDFRSIGDEMLSASNAKDVAKLVDAAGRLDAVCEACHVKYWYPQEVAAQNAAK